MKHCAFSWIIESQSGFKTFPFRVPVVFSSVILDLCPPVLCLAFNWRAQGWDVFLCRLWVVLFFLCSAGQGVKDFLSVLAISQSEWDVSKVLPGLADKGEDKRCKWELKQGFFLRLAVSSLGLKIKAWKKWVKWLWCLRFRNL